MTSVCDSLFEWARKKTSSFSELFFLDESDDLAADSGDELIYRLRQWPDLPPASKTAGIYQTLSVMSSRPVNRHWMLRHSGRPAAEVDRLLRRLVANEEVEVIDPSKFPVARAAA
ncbi:MAG: hypothetical protein HYX47_19920 [Burkholderiales bacterium]|nr:hypothetical protein [Burkholderiales bacterium]